MGGALYGSDAVAGVINVITSSGGEAEESNLPSQLGFGSDAQKEAKLLRHTSKAVERRYYLNLAGGFEETDGYDIREPATGLNYGYESQNLFASYSQPINESFTGTASCEMV